MNGYICFYNGKRFECHANLTIDARAQAVAHWKVPKSKLHLVSVCLAEKNGEQVVHSTAGL